MTTNTKTMARSASAIAQPNIALIKYWGKQGGARNLPAVGSLSVTLADLHTRTCVSLADENQDGFTLNGETEQAMAARCFAFIDRIWPDGDTRPALQIETHNNFPTAAGIASSASGFAALIVALNELMGWQLSQHKLAQLAGEGSGSAARSLYGGIVRLDAPATDQDDIKLACLPNTALAPLAVVIAVTNRERKQVGSTAAMTLSKNTSPFYASWVDSHLRDLEQAEAAVRGGDFAALAAVSEHSCLKMHAVMMASQPPLLYWNAASVAAMQRVVALREAGLHVFFTIDAGPQIKAICAADEADAVADALGSVDGVSDILRSGLGAGARLI